jgi:hypothetical protein
MIVKWGGKYENRSRIENGADRKCLE